MSDREIALWALVGIQMALMVAISVVKAPMIPERRFEPSPVKECRLVTGGQSWAPQDSVFVSYICPEETP